MTTATDPTSPSITLESGTYTSNANSGAFARVIDQSDTGTQIDSTRTSTTGLSSTSEVVIVHNADGSTTRETTTTNAQGQSTTDVTISAPQNGMLFITGSYTQTDGTVDQVSGTLFPTATGMSESLTLTNPDGATATSTSVFMHDGATSSSSVVGTGFGGNAFDGQSTSTILSSVSISVADLTGYPTAAGGGAQLPVAPPPAGFAAIVPPTAPDLLSGGTNTI